MAFALRPSPAGVGASSSAIFACRAGPAARPCAAAGERFFVSADAAPAEAVAPSGAPRLRLNNLSPNRNSRPDEKRKGRGYGGHQGGTCGFGTRGQLSRSGSKVRPGFEGGQMPLFRRMPKLKGIAGGMGAGLPKFVTVNLDDLDMFEANSEVTLESVLEAGIMKLTARESAKHLPLKVLGEGAITKALTIRAAAVSESAKAKLIEAGCTLEIDAGKPKWTRAAHNARVKEAAAAAK